MFPTPLQNIPRAAAMRVHLVALAAATLGVQAWTVMTSAIDRPLTTPPPRRRKPRLLPRRRCFRRRCKPALVHLVSRIGSFG